MGWDALEIPYRVSGDGSHSFGCDLYTQARLSCGAWRARRASGLRTLTGTPRTQTRGLDLRGSPRAWPPVTRSSQESTALKSMVATRPAL